MSDNSTGDTDRPPIEAIYEHATDDERLRALVACARALQQSGTEQPEEGDHDV